MLSCPGQVPTTDESRDAPCSRALLPEAAGSLSLVSLVHSVKCWLIDTFVLCKLSNVVLLSFVFFYLIILSVLGS